MSASLIKPKFQTKFQANRSSHLSQWQWGVCCDCHRISILGGGCEPRMGHLQYDTRSTRDLPHKPHMMWFLYTAPKLASLDMGSILKNDLSSSKFSVIIPSVAQWKQPGNYSLKKTIGLTVYSCPPVLRECGVKMQCCCLLSQMLGH